MPYSKDPAKYPPMLQELPALLARTTMTEVRIPAQDRREANTRRVQIQSYFSALGHKARECRALAQREADKRLKAAQLASNTREATRASAAREEAIRITKDDIHEAEAVARVWEDRADTVAGWMVRTIEADGVHCVEIAKRTLGDFGAKMLAAFDLPVVENGSPSTAQGDNAAAAGIVRPRCDAPAGSEGAIPPKQALVTEGITAPVETSVEAMLAKARQELQEKINSGELPR